MRPRSSEQRVLFFLVPTLIAVQIGAFALMWMANRDIAMETLDDELHSGAQVFQYALGQRSQYLRQGSELVARDFGFREAISSERRSTVESALANQLNRMGASLVVLSDLQDRIIGKGVPRVEGFPLDYPGLSDEALGAQVRQAQPGQINLLALRLDSHHQALYQWVKTVVRSPTPSAHLSFAFEIDDKAVLQLKQMTHLDFLFLSRSGTGSWKIHASSFEPEAQHAMGAGFEQLRVGFWTFPSRRTDYRMLAVDLGGDGQSRVFAVVGKSYQDVMLPFTKLERVFGLLVLFSVALCVIAVYRATHTIVAPLDKVVFQDGLTRLANRRLFELNLALATENLKALGRGYSLMVMDLNKFKAINDTLGHACGDQVLQEAARRIQAVIRHSDTIARLGGDEFALLLVTDDRHRAREIAARIIEQVRQPITLAQGQRVEVGVSIGIARAPENGTAADELLQLADEAMYAAKLDRCGFTFSRGPAVTVTPA